VAVDSLFHAFYNSTFFDERTRWTCGALGVALASGEGFGGF
jgi:hypothetical protein